nr:YigZ family protein [Demetria terragena]
MYLTLTAGADLAAETEVRRSRFLAIVRRVEDEEQARALVDEMRRRHRDARHHCTAFVVGPVPSVERSNDDGEPGGTAGAPMLEVLRGHQLSDVAAVVVRWFGGIKLGTGGLARAYAGAVQEALADAQFVRRRELGRFELSLAHADAGRVEAELRAHGVQVLGVDYASLATLQMVAADRAALVAQIAALTGGAAEPVQVGTTWIDDIL